MKNYFINCINPNHKKYEALRAYFIDGLSATEVAAKFHYQLSTVYSYIRDFKATNLKQNSIDDPFFKEVTSRVWNF